MPNCRRRGNVCLSLPTFYYRRDTLVLTLFRHSGQSVEGVSPAFKRLVADGFLHKVPSQYYPQCRYALTERGRQLVAFPPKGANWGRASTHKD